MDTHDAIAKHIECWSKHRGDFMYTGYLLRMAKKTEHKTEVTDESLNIYKNIKSILPEHFIITSQSTVISYCRTDSRIFHEILIVAENLACDYISLIDEVKLMAETRKLRTTALILISAIDDDIEIVKDVVLQILRYVSLGGVVYNGKKVYSNDKIVDNYYN